MLGIPCVHREQGLIGFVGNHCMLHWSRRVRSLILLGILVCLLTMAATMYSMMRRDKGP